MSSFGNALVETMQARIAASLAPVDPNEKTVIEKGLEILDEDLAIKRRNGVAQRREIIKALDDDIETAKSDKAKTKLEALMDAV